MPCNKQHIMRHNNGWRHKLLAQLILNQSQLKLFEVLYDHESNRYVCTICDFILAGLQRFFFFKSHLSSSDFTTAACWVLLFLFLFEKSLLHMISLRHACCGLVFIFILKSHLCSSDSNLACLLIFFILFFIFFYLENSPLHVISLWHTCWFLFFLFLSWKVTSSSNLGFSKFNGGWYLAKCFVLTGFSHPQFCLYDLVEKFPYEIFGYFEQFFPTTIERLESSNQ